MGTLRVELQRRVEVGVVGPSGLGIKRVGGRRHHADLGVVHAFVVVAVGEDLRGLVTGTAGPRVGWRAACGRRLAGLSGCRLRRLDRAQVKTVGVDSQVVCARGFVAAGVCRRGRAPHRAAASLPFDQQPPRNQHGVRLPILVLAQRQTFCGQPRLDLPSQCGVADGCSIRGHQGQQQRCHALRFVGGLDIQIRGCRQRGPPCSLFSLV